MQGTKNLAAGFLRIRPPIIALPDKAISWLTLVGMLMPLGILAELALGAPPALVPIGGISMVIAMLWFGVAAMKLDSASVGQRR